MRKSGLQGRGCEGYRRLQGKCVYFPIRTFADVAFILILLGLGSEDTSSCCRRPPRATPRDGGSQAPRTGMKGRNSFLKAVARGEQVPKGMGRVHLQPKDSHSLPWAGLMGHRSQP